MRLRIATEVKGDYRTVYKGFDRSLFEQLAPPFPKLLLRRFDGSRKGDEVHLELDMLVTKQQWHSRIVADGDTGTEAYFIDEGIKLPFFLRYWHHEHRIAQKAAGVVVLLDDITYKTGTLVTDILMYPAMWVQFAYRQPKYRKVFGKTS